MHHRQRDFGLLQHAQGIDRIELVGHDFGLDHQIGNFDRLVGDKARQDIAHLDHAQHPVGRPFGHGQQRVRAGVEHRAHCRLVRSDIDPVDLGARRHQLAHRALGQPHHALQHLVLFMLDHPAARGLGKQHVQFFGGNRALARGPHAKQADKQARRCIEQPHKRRSDLGQHRHRPRHIDCDRHSCA